MKQYARLTAQTAVRLAAPHTWVASVYPAVFGILFGRIRGYGLGFPSEALLAAACILLQSSVNTLNDYADYVKGTDSIEDNVEKTDAVLLYDNIRPAHALVLGILYLAAGTALGAVCSIRTGMLPLYIGAAGAAVVLLYSFGPLPLSYFPCGEAVSGLVMGGLIPLGVAAAADNRLHPEVLVYSLPLVMGIALIMMSNNGCDMEKDRAAGRYTLAVVLGKRGTVSVYRALILLWLTALCVLPVAAFGLSGSVCILLLLAFGKRFFAVLMRSNLEAAERITVMKNVVAANIFANGAYLAAAAVRLVLRG